VRLAALLLVAALTGCAAMQKSAGILDGALTALDAVCEARDSAYLDNARDLLASGDVLSAVEKLKMFLMTHGPDREVEALVKLLEAQLPEIPNG
jgi:hypothetical protein